MITPDGRTLLAESLTDAFLADRSQVSIPAYAGRVRIGEVEVEPAFVLTLGDAVLIGTNLIKYFTVTLEHGRRVIVEP